MKLKAWAEKEGISYITAYRWFKAGKLPVPAYQAESGTIIVEERPLEPDLVNKVIEISKTNGAVKDLATFMVSKFKLNSVKNTANTYSNNINFNSQTSGVYVGHSILNCNSNINATNYQNNLAETQVYSGSTSLPLNPVTYNEAQELLSAVLNTKDPIIITNTRINQMLYLDREVFDELCKSLKLKEEK